MNVAPGALVTVEVGGSRIVRTRLVARDDDHVALVAEPGALAGVDVTRGDLVTCRWHAGDGQQQVDSMVALRGVDGLIVDRQGDQIVVERRSSPRLYARLAVEWLVDGAELTPAETMDVSVGGMRIKGNDLPAGDFVVVRFELEGQIHTVKGAVEEMISKVVGPTEARVRFCEIDGQTRVALERLVENGVIDAGAR